VKTSDGLFQTKEFLGVCSKLLELLDALGTAFGMVKKDIAKNIGVLEKQRAADSLAGQDLFRMVGDDVRRSGTGDGSCGCSLLWLKRAMEFLLALVGNLVHHRDLTMTKAVADAYDKTLRPHHSTPVRLMISGLTKAVPNREQCEKKLGNGRDVLVPGQAFVAAFTPLVEEVDRWLVASNLTDSAA